jgi:hypothetical protein
VTGRVRKAPVAAVAALGLALAVGCAPKPPDFGYTNSYEPLYFALTTAQRNLSNLSEYQGRPVGGARAPAPGLLKGGGGYDQVASVQMPTSEASLFQSAYDDLRRALGVPRGADPRAVSSALRRFANAQAAGQPDQALRALGEPFFTLGPQGTLAALTNLPPLRTVESASYGLTRAASSMGDFTGPLR